VYIPLRKGIRRNISVGCSAHIIHNCFQTVADVLPIGIEALVVKIDK